jgi:hypothetical protein
MREKLTQEKLKSVLSYNPESGVFRWKSQHGRAKAGDKAGYISKHDGRVYIRVNRRLYTAHRLAFLYMEGYFPEYEVDHKWGITGDNRWKELRHVSHKCNLQNQKKNNKNTSGFPGVSYSGRDRRWVSCIKIDGRHIYIGSFTDPLEAALARYTVEAQCDKWRCNLRSDLTTAIKWAWPGFRPLGTQGGRG